MQPHHHDQPLSKMSVLARFCGRLIMTITQLALPKTRTMTAAAAAANEDISNS